MAASLEFQFRRRYNLPPTDPRFLDATFDEILVDAIAWDIALNPGKQEFADDEFDVQAEIAKNDAEETDDFEDI